MGKDIPDMDAKMEELRELIREANGTIKDMRREHKVIVDLMSRNMADLINTVILLKVDEYFEKFGEGINLAIIEAEGKIYRRFDEMLKTLMGEDDDSKEANLPSLEEMVKVYRTIKR